MSILFLLLLFISVTFNRGDVQTVLPGEAVETNFRRLSRLLDGFQADQNDRVLFSKTKIKEIFEHLFDFEKIAFRVLGKYGQSLNRYERIQAEKALEDAIQREILRHYFRIRGEGKIMWSLVSDEMKKDEAKLVYEISGGNREIVCILIMRANDQEAWKIHNVMTEDFRLITHYRNLVQNLLRKYSLSVLVAELRAQNSLLVDDFSNNRIGTFPVGWKWLPKDENDEKLFKVREERGNKYLNVQDRGDSVIYGMEFKWNIKRYPIISWRWRIHAIPEGGDERFNETNDSAAAVYIMYGRNFIGMPKVVKYVWSSTLAVGVATRRKGIGRPWSVVAKSGSSGIGVWYKEVFNAVEAYRQTFGGDPPENAIGIAILTDANSTKSYAEADYDDFKLLREASVDSGIMMFLEGGK
jgi:ABC-type transporter MlaC component